MMMAEGKSLHIGLNGVDASAYDGWPGPLSACEADADDMQALAKAAGFATKKLLTAKATRVAPAFVPPPRGASGHDPSAVPRHMPPEVAIRAYRAKKKLYDGIQKTPAKTEDDMKASVLLMSGCQDLQTSMDGEFNGAFTGAPLRVWNHGNFKGSYRTFHRKIQRLLPASQQPNLFSFGSGKAFARRHPFKI
jgi:hypothetical protein